MNGGYVSFRAELYERFVQEKAQATGNVSLDYPGAYDYFNEMFSANKVVIMPRINTSQGLLTPTQTAVMVKTPVEQIILIDHMNSYSVIVNPRERDKIYLNLVGG